MARCFFLIIVVVTILTTTGFAAKTELVEDIDLEELAYVITYGDLAHKDFNILQSLDQDQIDSLNVILQEVASEPLGDSPVIDGCENIYNWSLAG